MHLKIHKKILEGLFLEKKAYISTEMSNMYIYVTEKLMLTYTHTHTHNNQTHLSPLLDRSIVYIVCLFVRT